MKRCLPTTLLAALCALPAIAAPANPEPSAFPFIQAETFRLANAEVIVGEQWILARNILLDGDARDDLFLFAGASRLGLTTAGAGTMTLNGSIGGNLWAAGQSIEIHGPVEHHVRTAAQLLRIDSRIGGNLYSAASTVSLDTNSIVIGSARVLADYFILRGTVDGNLHITAREVRIDGIVHGSVFVKADKITILSNTRINGTLTCETAMAVMPDRQAVITGGLTQREPVSNDTFSMLQVLTTFLAFIGAILAGIFFFVFTPRYVVRSTLWMEACPWRTLLVGLAAFLLAPFAILFMFASLLGIPLALVTGTLYGLGIYLGRFIAALSLARLLTGARQRQPIPLPSPRLLLMGISFFYLATFLPDFLSDAIWFWFTITGMGGLILAVRGTPAPLLAEPAALTAKDSLSPPP